MFPRKTCNTLFHFSVSVVSIIILKIIYQNKLSSYFHKLSSQNQYSCIKIFYSYSNLVFSIMHIYNFGILHKQLLMFLHLFNVYVCVFVCACAPMLMHGCQRPVWTSWCSFHYLGSWSSISDCQVSHQVPLTSDQSLLPIVYNFSSLIQCNNLIILIIINPKIDQKDDDINDLSENHIVSGKSSLKEKLSSQGSWHAHVRDSLYRDQFAPQAPSHCGSTPTPSLQLQVLACTFL